MNNESDMLETNSDRIGDETPTRSEIVQEKSSIWSRWFGKRHISIEEVLFELDNAITQHPEAPTNYLLRGEYYLQIGYNQLAEQDFQQAVTLAEVELSEREWGLVAQVVRDRANRGLEIAHERLQHSKA